MAKIVLIVEDDPMLRTCVSEILTEYGGFQVHAAGNGNEALKLIEDGLAFDVLLTDYRMPGMDGATLVAELRHRGFTQFMILMTGYVRFPEAIEGVDRIVSKPFGTDDLVTLIRESAPRQAVA